MKTVITFAAETHTARQRDANRHIAPAGAPSWTTLGELTTLPRPSSRLGGDTPPHFPTPRRLRFLDLGTFGASYGLAPKLQGLAASSMVLFAAYHYMRILFVGIRSRNASLQYMQYFITGR